MLSLFTLILLSGFSNSDWDEMIQDCKEQIEIIKNKWALYTADEKGTRIKMDNFEWLVLTLEKPFGCGTRKFPLRNINYLGIELPDSKDSKDSKKASEQKKVADQKNSKDKKDQNEEKELTQADIRKRKIQLKRIIATRWRLPQDDGFIFFNDALYAILKWGYRHQVFANTSPDAKRVLNQLEEKFRESVIAKKKKVPMNLR